MRLDEPESWLDDLADADFGEDDANPSVLQPFNWIELATNPLSLIAFTGKTTAPDDHLASAGK